MDKFLFLPSTDTHETAVLLNLTQIYVNLENLQFRDDCVCMAHRHCILSLKIHYSENNELLIMGKERMIKFIDGLIGITTVEGLGLALAQLQADEFAKLKVVIEEAIPKKFSIQEFEMQEQEQEQFFSRLKERKM